MVWKIKDKVKKITRRTSPK